MIICDKCKKENIDNLQVFRAYFYPHSVRVEQALMMDICFDCMCKIFGKATVKEKIEEVNERWQKDD